METPTFEIREEKLSQKWDELHTLMVDHREELTTHKDLMILDPDKQKYLELERAGQLLTLVAYKQGVPVGYTVTLLVTTLHYRKLFVAVNDLLFLSPSARKSPIGLRLMRHTEQMATEKGCRMILWHAKKGSVLEKLLNKTKGMQVQDIVYSRVLGGN